MSRDESGGHGHSMQFSACRVSIGFSGAAIDGLIEIDTVFRVTAHCLDQTQFVPGTKIPNAAS
jgi:hypothetical protein